VSTARALWGKKFSANLHLPQSLGQVAKRIPARTGLTAHYFAVNNTIFPFLKPFLTAERGIRVLELLESKEPETIQALQLCGQLHSNSPKWQFFRYCEDCWNDDIRAYGEPYWHRLHQLQGILMCPVHEKPIQNSTAYLKDVSTNYHLASFSLASGESIPRYSDSAAEMLGNLAGDAAWVMQHGETLPSSERMYELFDQLLRLKGYRSLSGRRTRSKEFHAVLTDYYGQEVLTMLHTDPADLIPWSQLVISKKNNLMYPIYYLLFMRFLAGSAEAFYTKQHGAAHPYGESPWPCRNPACPHYLQDVIENLPMVSQCSWHRATFACPHCGFTYRRKQPVPKSEQYAGQIDIVDRGPLWMNAFRKMMEDGVPYYQIAKALQCYFNTIKRLAVEQGFLQEDQIPAKRNYNYPRGAAKKAVSKPAEPPDYRQVLLQAMRDNPGCSRSFLIKHYPEAYCWLRANDLEWYEANAPVSQRNACADWLVKDEDALQKAMKAVGYLRNLPGRPVWITRRSIEKYSGMNNLYKNLDKGNLPKTQTYLDSILETHEDWGKRKIQWAVRVMVDEGKKLHLPQVQLRASISHKFFEPLIPFVLSCIEELTK